MRSKEEANDYRYFPDPDLLPVVLDDAYIEEVRSELPELPAARRARFAADYALRDEDIETLTGSRRLADYFEAVAATVSDDPKLAANWVLGELSAALNRDGIEVGDSRVPPHALGELLLRIKDGTVSGKIAKDVFEAMWNGEGSADEIIDSKGLKQITDAGAIEAVVDEVLAASAEQVQQYRDGNQKVIGYLVGQVMKASQGKANPKQANEILRRKLAD
jgi:aspartyl-tRNA(Asn)/glutamyl-tRNA(Gln) amidotransferase subunit B